MDHITWSSWHNETPEDNPEEHASNDALEEGEILPEGKGDLDNHPDNKVENNHPEMNTDWTLFSSVMISQVWAAAGQQLQNKDQKSSHTIVGIRSCNICSRLDTNGSVNIWFTKQLLAYLDTNGYSISIWVSRYERTHILVNVWFTEQSITKAPVYILPRLNLAEATAWRECLLSPNQMWIRTGCESLGFLTNQAY